MATAIAVVMATACGTTGSRSSSKVTSSKPPGSAIVLSVPANVNQQGTAITFPAGEYRFSEADRTGYYFNAPKKVIVDDVAVFAYDGGLFIKRGSNEPTGWYFVRNGEKSLGRFRKVPAHKLIP